MLISTSDSHLHPTFPAAIRGRWCLGLRLLQTYICIYNYICVCLSYDPFDSSSFGYPRVVKQFDPENSICSKLILMARSMLGFGYLGIVTRYFESNCHGKIPRQDLAIECDSCSWPIFQRGTGPRKSVKADKDGQR